MIHQKTDEWYEARLGKVTASRVHCIMSTGRNAEFTKTAETYALELIAEEMTGFPTSAYGAALDWGNNYEPVARELIAEREKSEVLEVGFKYNDKIMLGGSADGILMEDFNPIPIEIKCPFNSVNHIKYAIGEPEDLPKEYWWQVQTQIFLYDSHKAYFYSFDPRNKKAKLIKKEVKRNEKDINLLKERVKKFLDYKTELQEKIK